MKDEKVVKNLMKYIRETLIQEFNYCGVCDGDKFILLNSGEGNIKIQMTWEEKLGQDIDDTVSTQLKE
jgi:uncharacterized protein YuzB (UPF0349 family)